MKTFILKGLFLAAFFLLLGSFSVLAANDDGLITEQFVVKVDKAGTFINKIPQFGIAQTANSGCLLYFQ